MAVPYSEAACAMFIPSEKYDDNKPSDLAIWSLVVSDGRCITTAGFALVAAVCSDGISQQFRDSYATRNDLFLLRSIGSDRCVQATNGTVSLESCFVGDFQIWADIQAPAPMIPYLPNFQYAGTNASSSSILGAFQPLYGSQTLVDRLRGTSGAASSAFHIDSRLPTSILIHETEGFKTVADYQTFNEDLNSVYGMLVVSGFQVLDIESYHVSPFNLKGHDFSQTLLHVNDPSNPGSSQFYSALSLAMAPQVSSMMDNKVSLAARTGMNVGTFSWPVPIPSPPSWTTLKTAVGNRLTALGWFDGRLVADAHNYVSLSAVRKKEVELGLYFLGTVSDEFAAYIESAVLARSDKLLNSANLLSQRRVYSPIPPNASWVIQVNFHVGKGNGFGLIYSRSDGTLLTRFLGDEPTINFLGPTEGTFVSEHDPWDVTPDMRRIFLKASKMLCRKGGCS